VDADGEHIDADADMVGDTKHSDTEQETKDCPGSTAESPEDDANECMAADAKKTDAQIFQITISLRDDWLHGGDALQDMDLQTYAEFIERQAKPVRGTDLEKISHQGVFAFDRHYKLAPGYMQVLKP
jgi:hypothetical protein